jgi:hypothetical protein
LEVRERLRGKDILSESPIQSMDNVDRFRINLQSGKMREQDVPCFIWREESQKLRHEGSSNPKSESKEVGGQPKGDEGCGIEDLPVGRQAEGNVAKLEDLVDGERECEEGGPKQGEFEAEGGHGEEEDVGKDKENVMERHNPLPTNMGKERDAIELFVLREGNEIEHDEIGEGKESQRHGEREETMDFACLKNERNGWKDISDMDREQKFAKAAVHQAEGRQGMHKNDTER